VTVSLTVADLKAAGLLGTDKPLASCYDLALVDLDGVTYQGALPIAHAADGLTAARAAGLRLTFVTNNASRVPDDVANQLTSLDIPTQPQEVVTSAQACAALLRTRLEPGAKVLVVGGAGLITAVKAEGFTVVTSADDTPDAVAQGFAPTVAWTHLAEAAYAVAAGAWFVASNLDMSLPQTRGYAPGNGALAAAVQAATGVAPANSGKPGPAMYELAVARAGAANPLVIGDRLDTDLAGARSAGFAGLHVLTGVSSARDDILANPTMRPHYVGADLRVLAEPQPAPVKTGDGWWQVEGRAARVTAGRLELDRQGPQGINAVRAACAAAWEAADAGHTLDESTLPQFTA
jgi:HAD superfamily hydrolase (TIGR01450 family)